MHFDAKMGCDNNKGQFFSLKNNSIEIKIESGPPLLREKNSCTSENVCTSVNYRKGGNRTFSASYLNVFAGEKWSFEISYAKVRNPTHSTEKLLSGIWERKTANRGPLMEGN